MVFLDAFWDFFLHWYVGLSSSFFYWFCIFLLIGFDTHIQSLRQLFLGPIMGKSKSNMAGWRPKIHDRPKMAFDHVN